MNNNKSTNMGSVYYNKQRKNWIASYEILDKETKKPKRVRKSFFSKEEADRYLRIIQYQKENEIFIKNNSIPVFELMLLILRRKQATNKIGKTAYNRLKSTLNVIEKSEVAHKDINDISSEELQDYFNTLTHYSNSYIRKIIEQFSQAFTYAMNKGFLIQNPMCDTIVPKSTKEDKEVRSLDIYEQRQLTDYLKNTSIVDEPYKNAFLIEMYMGLRIGEILALNKNNVNLRSNFIHVEPNMIRDGEGNPIIKSTPKTKKSIRDVPIPEIIRDEIIEQMHLADCHKEQLLFVSNNGGYVNPTNANHVLKRICKNLDIKNVSTHSLRHTFATRCIESGMKPLALKELLGHSKVSITLDVYTSLFNKYRDSELENLNNYYRHAGIIEKLELSEKDKIINFPILNNEKIVRDKFNNER